MNLKEQVEQLISMRYEGEYWDFKEKYSEKKADLLHDIICMANNLTDKDGLIIFGISDSFEVIDITDDPNRKNQQNIITFLKSKSFAGDIIPQIELKVVQVNGKNVDVLIVKNTDKVPYYLTEDYRDGEKVVKANYIYTRVGDTNTSINDSAKIDKVEELWKKRFGINSTILWKAECLIENCDSWKRDLDDKPWYNKIMPEFRFEYGQALELEGERICGFYTNKKGYYRKFRILYNSTPIYEDDMWYLDEMRLEVPQLGFRIIEIDGKVNYYYYIDKTTIKGKLLKLFSKGTYNLEPRGSNERGILLFENSIEQYSFENYIKENSKILNNYETSFWGREAIKYENTIGYPEGISEFHDKLYSVYIEWKKQFECPVVQVILL